MVWLNIDFKYLPEELINKYFIPTKRGLYSSESHYLNIPATTKNLKNTGLRHTIIRIIEQTWYGLYYSFRWFNVGRINKRSENLTK